jgi:hypothetical protein
MKFLGIVALSCVLVPLAPAETRPGDERVLVRNLVPAAAGGTTLHWAVLGAHRRLQQPACRELFAEFSDAAGRTLQENLDAMGESAATYPSLILFADGTGRSRCRERDVFAFTTPGSRVVHVCGRQLKGLAERSPVRAQAIVIHEVLHTLGLGENPPSSTEITARVLARCQQ